MSNEELKAKYPLAVKQIENKQFSYNPARKAIVDGKDDFFGHKPIFLEIKRLLPLSIDSPKEVDQIGEMLAEFFNTLNQAK